jgi:ATP-dependent RNA helicase DOB1
LGANTSISHYVNCFYLSEKMEPAVCKGILYGDPDPLNSSYKISYNMLLNLMRVEDVEPEFLLRASFHQFQREKEAPALIAQAQDLENDAESIEVGSSEEVELAKEYYQMDQQLLLIKQKISRIVQKPEYILKFLQVAGRLLDITIDDQNFGWGVLTSFKKKTGGGAGGGAGKLAELSNQPIYTLEVLIPCVDRHFDGVDDNDKEEDVKDAPLLWRGTVRHCRPVKPGDEEKVVSMRLFTVSLQHIDRISAVRIFTPQAVSTPEARKKVSLSVNEVKKRFPDGIPLLDPVKDLGIEEDTFKTLMDRAADLGERLAAHKLAVDFPEEDRFRLVQAFENRSDVKERARALRDEAKSCQTMAMKDELKKMKRVLKKLGHVDGNGVIQTKGRTACEINTANELVVTELIFTGVFKSLAVEQCVALLSVMAFDERNKDDDDPTKGLKSFLLNPFHKLQEVAKTVAKVQIECGLDVDEDEFLDQFNPLM